MTIAVSPITVPTGKALDETVTITAGFDAVPTVASVVLYKDGSPHASAPMALSGLTGTAMFGPGKVGEGTFEVYVLARSATDEGSGQGLDLVVEDAERIVTGLVNILRGLLQDSPLLSYVDDTDIHPDRLDLRGSDPLNPGIIIQRGEYRPRWLTTSKKEYPVELHVFPTTKSNWHSEKDDIDREAVEKLADDTRMAIEADPYFGGFLYLPVEIVVASPAMPANLNDSSFWEVITIRCKVKRLVDC